MRRKEFMQRLCFELEKFRTPEGLTIFPCICGNNPIANDNDAIEDKDVAEAIIKLVSAMAMDNNEA